MKKKETVEEFTKRVLRESKFDINIDYEKVVNFDDEIDFFNTDSNKACF